MSDLPAPLVPPEVDLRDFAFTPLYRARLFGSAFHARATDAEWRAGLTLWLKSQDQHPSGSLPDDDIDLCRLAELGRDLRTWRKIKAGALRGWVKCSDGRLYHTVIAEIVTAQWKSKQAQRDRTEKARLARQSQRAQTSVTDNATDSKGEVREVKGSEGKGIEESDADASVVGVEAADPLEIPGFLDKLTPYVTAYNALAEKLRLPLVEKLTNDRKAKLRARLREHGGESWALVLGQLEHERWMLGDNDRGWRADFDYLLQPKAFNRLIERAHERHHAPAADPAAQASAGGNGPAPGFVPRIDPRALAEYGDGVATDGLVPER